MTDETHENAVNSVKLQNMLKELSVDQIRFVSARQFAKSDKDAALEIGINPDTASHWKNKKDIDEIVKLLTLDGVIVAGELLKRHLPKAALELGEELDHKDVIVRHRAATEILDRTMGKPLQKLEATGKDGAPLIISVTIGGDKDDAQS